jgi:hypothetical protein
MRFLIIITALICISSSSAFSKSEANFDAFIKSREVITTLYFQSNDEALGKSERKRLLGAISKLRELQENGHLIRIEGFSSPGGDPEKNFHLSFFRARAVADLIESKGFPAEVTLTGYGDLRAGSGDPKKERRVEIASYLKPVSMRRVKVNGKKKNTRQRPELMTTTLMPKDQDINSYKIDQAIRTKIDNKNKGLTDVHETIDYESSSGLSQTDKIKNNKIDTAADLDRRYGLWRQSVTSGSPLKLSQAKTTADSKTKRSLSQLKKSVDSDSSLDVTQILPVAAPVIDALMIEQAIMEKIGAELPAPSGTVSKLSIDH